MPGGRISLGLVVGLDYRDPLFDPHTAFQRFKLHPLVADLLRGGQLREVRREGAARRRLEHASRGSGWTARSSRATPAAS